MPGIGGLDNSFDVNETSNAGSITSSLTNFALNLGSALATVGITKLVQGTHAGQVIATGIPSNPVQVIPAGQAAAQQQLALAAASTNISKYIPVLLFSGVALLGIFAFSALRK